MGNTQKKREEKCEMLTYSILAAKKIKKKNPMELNFWKTLFSEKNIF